MNSPILSRDSFQGFFPGILNGIEAGGKEVELDRWGRRLLSKEGDSVDGVARRS